MSSTEHAASYLIPKQNIVVYRYCLQFMDEKASNSIFFLRHTLGKARDREMGPVRAKLEGRLQ